MSRPLIELSEREILQIESLAGLGFSIPEIASALGISERTFHNKKQSDAEVFAAWTRGKLKPKAVVGAVALRNAIEGDQRAVEFYLGSYCGISPRHAETAALENPEDPLEVADPHMELLRRYEEIAARQAEAEMPEDMREPEPVEHNPPDDAPADAKEETDGNKTEDAGPDTGRGSFAARRRAS